VRNRVKYPENHIEVDNRLAYFLGRLENRYGDDPFYVHLKRNRIETAESLSRGSYEGGIVECYRKKIITTSITSNENYQREGITPVETCKHYCDTVNTNIELFVKDKTKKMEFRLESAEDDFRRFWERIGAEGDMSASMQEWGRKYNASDSKEAPEEEAPEEEAPEEEAPQISSLPVRAIRKAVRAAREFPTFLREV
jgi:hypothetical protein